jgi:predicted nucleotidyltransferase
MRTVYSHIDVVIGSLGNPLIKEKVNLLNYLQENIKTLKVHVDYSDDIISNVAEDFLRENNVRFMI